MNEMKKYDRTCPVCGEEASMVARRMQVESHCPNKHVWHCCSVHGVNVLGNVPNGTVGTCTCAMPNSTKREGYGNGPNILLFSFNRGLLVEYFEFLEKRDLFATFWTVPPGPDDMCSIDYVIALGGDGTVLEAMETAVQLDAPLIGINEGHLGFMSLHFDDDPKETLLKVVKMLGRDSPNLMREEKRSLLTCDIFDKFILNEVAFLPTKVGTMIDLDLFVNGELLSRYQGDGLIISTPSGSTAYNLSAAGPIVHVDTDLIIITPLASFSLSSRPIVIPGDSQITVLKHGKEFLDGIMMVADGRDRKETWSDQPTIQRADKTLRLMRPKNVSFVDTCREKLKWRNHTKA